MMLDPAMAYMVLLTDFASKIDGLWAFQVTVDFDNEKALYQTYVFLDALSGYLTGVAVDTIDFEQFKSSVLPWFLTTKKPG